MADGLLMGKMGDAGEMEKGDEVVEGGERVDFELMWTGLANACRGEKADDVEQEEGETDKSLPLSLSLWSAAARLICNLEKGDAMVSFSALACCKEEGGKRWGKEWSGERMKFFFKDCEEYKSLEGSSGGKLKGYSVLADF